MRRLSATLAERAPLAEQPVTLVAAPQEMLPLLAALNGLLSRIAALIDAERRFTADAAHELRTPIAAIRAQAQAALGAVDDSERRRTLNRTLAGCDRAAHLVEQLLTLARLEATSPGRNVAIDLAFQARETIALAAGNALLRDQDIELDALQPCKLDADPALVGVLIRNLVDNAVRYSPKGARIRIAVERRGDEAWLRVEDSGPGLAADDLARLGERFFRVLGNDQSGSGLGWSIVRRIARAQGARLSAERSTALGGLAVSVVWPVSRADPGAAGGAASSSLSGAQMQRPPSTSIATPVTIDASSLHR
jgi:two-component system sensor histidine kinase QseC